MKVLGSLLLFKCCLIGSEIVVEAPKRITRKWEEKVFGVKYRVTTLDNAVSEMVEGLIDDTFGQDFIHRVQKEIQGHPGGERVYIEYWKNGQKKASLPYKDGRAHGHVHGWFENGKDAFKGYFHDGLKQGIHMTFFEVSLGDPKKARCLFYNNKGNLSGEITRNHKKGGLWLCMDYEDGVPHGAFEGWNKKGECYIAAQYKNGALQKNPPPPMSERPEPKPDPADKLIDEVIKEFVANSYIKYGIKAYGVGGQMPYDIETISIDFYVYKRGTIDSARELMVRLKKDLTEIVNKKEGLHPYLREYPFKEKRADITLSFCDKNGKLFEGSESIWFVCMGKGNIRYLQHQENGPSKELLKEPYAEAVKIVNNKKQHSPKK